MPQVKNGLLTPREKEYLQNPDDFDSQTRAEIRYSIRQKWDEFESDYELLSDNIDNWSKRVKPDNFSRRWALVECKCCNKKDIKSLFKYSHDVNEFEFYFENMDNWHINYRSSISEGRISDSVSNYEEMKQDFNDCLGDSPYEFEGISITSYTGVCPDCYDEPEIIEEAKQTGMVPNPYRDQKHQIDSNPFKENREEIPISEEKMKEIREHRDMA